MLLFMFLHLFLSYKYYRQWHMSPKMHINYNGFYSICRISYSHLHRVNVPSSHIKSATEVHFSLCHFSFSPFRNCTRGTECWKLHLQWKETNTLQFRVTEVAQRHDHAVCAAHSPSGEPQTAVTMLYPHDWLLTLTESVWCKAKPKKKTLNMKTRIATSFYKVGTLQCICLCNERINWHNHVYPVLLSCNCFILGWIYFDNFRAIRFNLPSDLKSDFLPCGCSTLYIDFGILVLMVTIIIKG